MAVQAPRRPAAPPARPAPRPGTITQRKRKDPLWARLTLTFGAVLMIAAGIGIAGSKWLITSATNSINRETLIAGEDQAVGNALDGPINMLLLGVDVRPDWEINDTRADTIIILHIPATHDQAYLVSVPRDSALRSPAFPKSQWPGGTTKATEVFFHGAQHGAGWSGGAQLMAKTLKQETGVTFDGAAIIDFSGFKGVIEELGGVRMCVDQEVRSAHLYWVDGKAIYKADARKLGRLQEPVVHKKGCRTMKAWEALDFARQRYGLKNGDYDRQRHQQQLLKAMAKKAAESGAMSNPLKVKDLMKAGGKAFTLDTGGADVADFLFTLRGVAANDLVLLRTNSGTFSGDGSGREVFNAQSQAMFAALKNDKMAEFLIQNPSVVAREK